MRVYQELDKSVSLKFWIPDIESDDLAANVQR